MKGLRTTVSIIGAWIGLVTLLYIGVQFATKGPQSSRMAQTLSAEIAAFKPPGAATFVNRETAWEPGWARASEYYKTSLSPAQIQQHYSIELVSQGWAAGPMPRTRPLTKVAAVYHKDDREFRLSFAPPGSERTYEISLLWGH
jgi:hypothetical protein